MNLHLLTGNAVSTIMIKRTHHSNGTLILKNDSDINEIVWDRLAYHWESDKLKRNSGMP